MARRRPPLRGSTLLPAAATIVAAGQQHGFPTGHGPQARAPPLRPTPVSGSACRARPLLRLVHRRPCLPRASACCAPHAAPCAAAGSCAPAKSAPFHSGRLASAPAPRRPTPVAASPVAGCSACRLLVGLPAAGSAPPVAACSEPPLPPGLRLAGFRSPCGRPPSSPPGRPARDARVRRLRTRAGFPAPAGHCRSPCSEEKKTEKKVPVKKKHPVSPVRRPVTCARPLPFRGSPLLQAASWSPPSSWLLPATRPLPAPRLWRLLLRLANPAAPLHRRGCTLQPA
nr:lysine-rich arabinogalactan protein 19-like [Aegilops tauschii subsp. strangulata]